ncbi:MAG: UvrD-helicase domain-containing protein [Bdellovibrionales bacterium]|nr:UvrD-helicase domain-containing protein [Bdellovibrionales bacterium]
MSSEAREVPEYLETLNEQQLKGALHFEGPILILAGAGSGKTRVLTHRIAHLIDYYGVPPQAILAVTFTNKAAEEMKRRLTGLLGDKGNRVWASTFHSLGLRILRRHAHHLGYSNDFVVYDQQDAKALLKEISKELKVDDSKYPIPFLQRSIESAKNKCLLPDEYSKQLANYAESIVGDVYDRYQRTLLKNNAMDFSDLLLNPLLLLSQNKEVLARYQNDLQFVLVDEFQDTNEIQYKLIRLLAAPQNNLFVVGDDDQSIYAFRGATIENILHFERDFKNAQVVALEQNYRSSQNILDASNAVIAKNSERRSKTLWTEDAAGQTLRGYVAMDENDEAHFIAREIDGLRRAGRRLSEIAIFYRTNAQSRAIEDALMAQAIPYRIFGGLKFYDRKEIKDILAYLKLAVNELDDQSFQRCVNTPPRGLGPKSIETLREYAKAYDCSLFQAAKRLTDGGKSLAAFVALIEEFQTALETEPLYELIGRVVERSGYSKKLKAMKDVTAQSRLENLDELRNIAVGMTYVADTPANDLRMFLDRVSLTSSEELPVEEAKEGEEQAPPDTVSLMTLHLAKGLEFPIVFLTGLEEGSLPHYRSLESEFELSEERRLCYVGMTRAMEKLYLSRAERRGMFSSGGNSAGMFSGREPSRFVFDVPEGCFDDDSRHFASHTGGFGAVHYEYRDELTFDEVQARRAERDRQKMSKRMKPAVIKSADSLEESGMSSSDFSAYQQAAISDLAEGTKVIHRIFGEGQIENIDEVDESDPGKAKITVRFQSFELPKKLVFRHAKLALLS